MTEPFRHERAGVAFPQMAWTSFDRYGRYGAIVRALRANLGAGSGLRVLDVGDTAGHLQSFDADLRVVGVDLNIATERLGDPVIARADGAHLPFPDGSFDAVVSSDVLEHVPPPSRPAFLAELRRVSSDLVIVAAPFDTPGVAGVEELVRRYALLSTGTKQLQLDEHQDHGLPDLDAAVGVLSAGPEVGGAEPGGSVVVQGDGHLWDWLVVMLLRFQLESRPALEPLAAGYDVLYNLSLADRSLLPPYYRHLLIARRSGEAMTGARPPSDDVPVGMPSDFAALAAALISADSTEVTRQDTVPRLDRLQADLDSVHARLDRLDPVPGELTELRARLESLIELQVSVADQLSGLRDKLRRLTRPFGRKTGDQAGSGRRSGRRSGLSRGGERDHDHGPLSQLGVEAASRGVGPVGHGSEALERVLVGLGGVDHRDGDLAGTTGEVLADRGLVAAHAPERQELGQPVGVVDVGALHVDHAGRRVGVHRGDAPAGAVDADGGGDADRLPVERDVQEGVGVGRAALGAQQRDAGLRRSGAEAGAVGRSAGAEVRAVGLRPAGGGPGEGDHDHHGQQQEPAHGDAPDHQGVAVRRARRRRRRRGQGVGGPGAAVPPAQLARSMRVGVPAGGGHGRGS